MQRGYMQSSNGKRWYQDASGQQINTVARYIPDNTDILKIFESITEAFFTLDREWRFSYLNSEAERILDRSREGLLGKDVWEEFPNAVRSIFYEKYHRAMAQQVRVEFEEYCPPLKTWFEVKVYPLKSGLSVFLRNINSRREAEEALRQSKERYQVIVERFVDGIYWFDGDTGRVTGANLALQEMLGYTSDELHGMHLDDLLAHEPGDAKHSTSRTPELRHHFVGDRKYRRKDGFTLDVEVRESTSSNGDKQVVCAVVRDVTERKQAEEELREANRRLNELTALKAVFTAMVAHELGSPLAAIRRLTEMLSTGETEQEVKAYAIDAIVQELDTMDALVADVQTSAAVERDDFRVQLRPVPLEELLADAKAFALVLPGDHPINFVLDRSLDTRERVVADPERIGQVLRNLLSNAVRYTPEGLPIELRAKSRNARVRIEVADHGPGIHPEDVARIFDKFERGRDREGKRIKGVGLGLYISRGIVRAHGGIITVNSAPDEGAVFGFELEMARKEAR
jgi:PAS domain S-box-containing protein